MNGKKRLSIILNNVQAVAAKADKSSDTTEVREYLEDLAEAIRQARLLVDLETGQ